MIIGTCVLVLQVECIIRQRIESSSAIDCLVRTSEGWVKVLNARQRRHGSERTKSRIPDAGCAYKRLQGAQLWFDGGGAQEVVGCDQRGDLRESRRARRQTCSSRAGMAYMQKSVLYFIETPLSEQCLLTDQRKSLPSADNV